SEDAERASRTAELALAKATADHAGVEAEWRIAEAEVAQAQSRLARLDGEARRIADQRSALAAQGDPEQAAKKARHHLEEATTAPARARQAVVDCQTLQEPHAAARHEFVSTQATTTPVSASI